MKTATQVAMRTFGEIVGTREQGSKVRPEILHQLREIPEGETLILDFDGVQVFSGSFADEVVALPYQRLVNGEYGDRYIVIRSKEREVLEDLEAKLEKRELAILVIRNGEWEVIGPLAEHLNETLRVIVSRGEISTPELAEVLDISLTNCNNRVVVLERLRLIERKRMNNPQGGIYYVNRSFI